MQSDSRTPESGGCASKFCEYLVVLVLLLLVSIKEELFSFARSNRRHLARKSEEQLSEHCCYYSGGGGVLCAERKSQVRRLTFNVFSLRKKFLRMNCLIQASEGQNRYIFRRGSSFLQSRALMGGGRWEERTHQLLTQIMGKHIPNTAKYGVDVETLIQFGI